MAGRIDQFWAQLNAEGIAKNSHWDVLIPIPPSLVGTEFSEMSRTLTLRCEAGELPGRQVVTNDIKIYGPIYRTPYQSLYAELNLTFIETQDMKVRRFMEAWLDTIYNATTNILNYQNTYETTLTLTQYALEPRPQAPTSQGIAFGDLSTVNATNTPPQGVRPILFMDLYRTYPINVNQMSTAWSDDSPHRVQVTFFYEWYTISAPGQPGQGNAQGLPLPPTTTNNPVGLDDTGTDWFKQTQQVR